MKQEIKMLDLKKQYSLIEDEINSSVIKVFKETNFIKGKEVEIFSNNLKKYLNVKHVIPCGNGTDALKISLMSLGLKKGDEIITTGFTFVATVEVIVLLGLVPVMVDIDPRTFNICPDSIKKAISEKTKAIIPVHLFGQCADMEKINEIAKRYNLFVIEDNAQALGSNYIFNDNTIKKAGTIGDIGCTSFFPSKVLGAFGDGGAIFTNNDDLSEKIDLIANHGMDKLYSYKYIGINSRLDTVQASILDIKLKYLDSYIELRNRIASKYDSAFSIIKNIKIPYRANYTTHVFYLYSILLKDIKREDFRKYLFNKGIDNKIHYQIPLFQQEAYKDYCKLYTNYQNTIDVCNSIISIPIYPELEEDQVEYIIDSIKKYFIK